MQKRKRLMHQVFNIWWQTVSCWFMLLMLYFPLLDTYVCRLNLNILHVEKGPQNRWWFEYWSVNQMVIWKHNYHGTGHLNSESFDNRTNSNDLNTLLVCFSDLHCTSEVKTESVKQLCSFGFEQAMISLQGWQIKVYFELPVILFFFQILHDYPLLL